LLEKQISIKIYKLGSSLIKFEKRRNMKNTRERIIEEINDLPESEIPKIYKLLRLMKSEFLKNEGSADGGNLEAVLSSAGIWKEIPEDELKIFSGIIDHNVAIS